MFSMELIRNNEKEVRANFLRRKDQKILENLDELIKTDKAWREALQDAEELKRKRNEISREIGRIQGNERQEKIKQAKELGDKIKELDEKTAEYQKKARQLRNSLPNMMHKSVPYGKDDSENVEIRKYGKKPVFKFNAKSSTDIFEEMKLVDMERAAKISGARFYFLKNELVMLNLALQRFALEYLSKKGFEIIEPPFMINKKAMAGVIPMGDFEEVIYKIEDEDLFLIATAEHPLGAMRMKEILDKKELPVKYAGISPCFRKEAGAHGKDTKGIFRVHQFDKIEQFIFCEPKDSWKLHEELIKNAEGIFKALKVPYRVVNICTGDLGYVAAKKYDIEGWFPGQGKYRELCSCSNCTDYQSRRLAVKYRPEQHLKSEYVHTLNSTAIAIQRAICCIAENYQTKKGFKIPKVLQEYMGGLKEVKVNKS